MIIAISGSVGSGKSSVSELIGNELGYKVINLNDWSQDFKLNYNKKLQTFDFDIDSLLDKVDEYIQKHKLKNVIFESHFSHFINYKLVDYLFIINRDLKDLKIEYIKRNYPENKIKDNLEVESFNLCFYEALKNGYE
jgi:broad-specificity NMP kinase